MYVRSAFSAPVMGEIQVKSGSAGSFYRFVILKSGNIELSFEFFTSSCFARGLEVLTVSRVVGMAAFFLSAVFFFCAICDYLWEHIGRQASH